MNFSIGTILLDLFFPIACVGCGKAKIHYCSECIEKMQPSSVLLHGTPGGTLDHFFSVAEVNKNSAFMDLVHRFKYDGASEIAEILAEAVAFAAMEFFAALSACPQIVFVPVPLHWKRKNFRGFNQSLLLAEALTRQTGIPTHDLLVRHRATRPQVELSQEKRQKNIIAAFSLKNRWQKIDSEISYCVVDDVYTTGSTMNECAKVLRKHGAKIVNGLAVMKA